MIMRQIDVATKQNVGFPVWLKQSPTV